jgi:hypothetical protein
MVRQIKNAGAIVLAKSNLAEWAFTPNETLSSILPGYTKNPFALDRVTAGSSGGTDCRLGQKISLGQNKSARQLDEEPRLEPNLQEPYSLQSASRPRVYEHWLQALHACCRFWRG